MVLDVTAVLGYMTQPTAILWGDTSVNGVILCVAGGHKLGLRDMIFKTQTRFMGPKFCLINRMSNC